MVEGGRFVEGVCDFEGGFGGGCGGIEAAV